MRHSRLKTSLVRLAAYTIIPVLFITAGLPDTAAAGTTCQQLVIPTTATLVDPDAGDLYYSLANGQQGVTMTLELYSAEAGTFDLAAGLNLNYSTCDQCVLLRTDAVGETPAKLFFQDHGTLGLSVAPGADPLPVVFNALRLVETTVDPETFQSTPVPNGECYARSGSVFADGFESQVPATP